MHLDGHQRGEHVSEVWGDRIGDGGGLGKWRFWKSWQGADVGDAFMILKMRVEAYKKSMFLCLKDCNMYP